MSAHRCLPDGYVRELDETLHRTRRVVRYLDETLDARRTVTTSACRLWNSRTAPSVTLSQSSKARRPAREGPATAAAHPEIPPVHEPPA